jgi:hypothetical protein
MMLTLDAVFINILLEFPNVLSALSNLFLQVESYWIPYESPWGVKIYRFDRVFLRDYSTPLQGITPLRTFTPDTTSSSLAAHQQTTRQPRNLELIGRCSLVRVALRGSYSIKHKDQFGKRNLSLNEFITHGQSH